MGPPCSGAPAPFTSGSTSQIQFETSKGGSSIQVERQDVVTLGGLKSPDPTPTPLSGLDDTPRSQAARPKSPQNQTSLVDSVVQVIPLLIINEMNGINTSVQFESLITS